MVLALAASAGTAWAAQGRQPDRPASTSRSATTGLSAGVGQLSSEREEARYLNSARTFATRASLCSQYGAGRKSKACADAIALGGRYLNAFPTVTGVGTMNQLRTKVADGKLCSAGKGRYAGYDAVASSWPVTHLSAGKRWTFTLPASNGTRGTVSLYVTKAGYRSTLPLTWDSLQARPFTTISLSRPNYRGAFRFDAKLPRIKGDAVIYAVFQRADRRGGYVGCSDVTFDGGHGQVTWPGNRPGPAPGPNPDPTTSPVPTQTTSPGPTQTTSPAPTQTTSPAPTQTTSPVPTETTSPAPTGTTSPAPTETTSPAPTGTTTPAPTQTSAPSSDCTVQIAQVLWPTVHMTTLTLLNGKTPADSWKATLDVPSGQSLLGTFNAGISLSGTTMTATAPEWNTSLDAGEEASFGYVAEGPAKPVPANIKLNGASCAVTGTTEQNADGSTPAPTGTVAPTQTSSPAPTETTSPAPTDTTSPAPTETTSPAPTETTSPAPTGTTTPAPTQTSAPSSDCTVQIAQVLWPTVHMTTLTLLNGKTPADSWKATFDVPSGQSLLGTFNAELALDGTTMTATAPEWNTSLDAGEEASFGYVAEGPAKPVPANIKLNGASCTVTGTTEQNADGTTPAPTGGTDPTGTTTAAPSTSAGPVPSGSTSAGGSVPAGGGHVDNPFVGAKVYVNPDWSRKAAAEPGGSKVSGQPTGVWLDSIAAIGAPAGSGYTTGLRKHLDNALAQGASLAEFVIYNLPGRDCAALASNGELGPTEIDKYKNAYIDPIAAIEADPKYASIRIVNIIEIDSLPNLVTNAGGTAGSTQACQTMKANGNYVTGVRYALSKLHAAGTNTYTYIDAAHHGWLGWDSNFAPAADLLATTAKGATGGVDTVDGFITDTANYSALTEPFLKITSTVGGQQVRQSKWVDWNQYVDELSFAQAFRTKLVASGFNPGIGMLIDTSRNGWGGPARPTSASTATDLNTWVDASRTDRRIHAGNWCNQSGAGLGERPRPAPEPGIDAYVWIKPPGESDGSSSLIPTGTANPTGKGFDQMCDPTYTGNARNGNNKTGALPDAPVSGAWFSTQFRQLLANANPPLN